MHPKFKYCRLAGGKKPKEKTSLIKEKYYCIGQVQQVRVCNYKQTSFNAYFSKTYQKQAIIAYYYSLAVRNLIYNLNKHVENTL
jgi:hypothetical protein